MKLDLDRQGGGRSELLIEGFLDLGVPRGRPSRAEIRGNLRVDNVGSRFLVAGSLDAVGIAECSRCLGQFELAWEVPVEIMVLRKVDSEEGTEDSLVLHQTAGVVDMKGPLRECVVLAYPQAPVCRENCRGICPQCGTDLNESSCDCVEEEVDPRWEGLP